jgi:hypothetical protein
MVPVVVIGPVEMWKKFWKTLIPKALCLRKSCEKSCGKKLTRCRTCGTFDGGPKRFHRFHSGSTGSFPQICGKTV